MGVYKLGGGAQIYVKKWYTSIEEWKKPNKYLCPPPPLYVLLLAWCHLSIYRKKCRYKTTSQKKIQTVHNLFIFFSQIRMVWIDLTPPPPIKTKVNPLIYGGEVVFCPFLGKSSDDPYLGREVKVREEEEVRLNLNYATLIKWHL